MSLGVKEFSDYIYEKLVDLEDVVILTAPNIESKFPCREMQTPFKTVTKTRALETFQISIKHWTDNPKDAMLMSDKTDEKLLEYNLIRISNSTCIYDENLQKYGLIVTYEVKYNVLTNKFELTK